HILLPLDKLGNYPFYRTPGACVDVAWMRHAAATSMRPCDSANPNRRHHRTVLNAHKKLLRVCCALSTRCPIQGKIDVKPPFAALGLAVAAAAIPCASPAAEPAAPDAVAL